ncbi:hypothetical protein KP509_09G014200 [Ceratopteris richardii]|uniref:Fe2OG dioxygenase domain-containing protein n=1 Tax=Ceratopteris richardii TaxID=49495 RepID=A0A8T2U4A0_CERRI|nr:hypothetical protein KP509_09G014200 [Ceratopteris richardii]
MERERKDLQEALTAVFGESDSESDTETEVPCNYSWKAVKEIPGLWLCKGFLSAQQQEELVSAIDSEGWFIDSKHNQAMRFKDLPDWAFELSQFIHDAVSSYALANDSLYLSAESKISMSDMPFNLNLLQRVPLFDQMIVNRYQPGEGICAHVDLLRFEDGIAILSLESTCVMHFTQCMPNVSILESELRYNHQAGHTFAANQKQSCGQQEKVPVLLEPGDLVLLSGEARYKWTHEINRSEACQTWEGELICQMRRTSVTLRKLTISEEVHTS